MTNTYHCPPLLHHLPLKKGGTSETPEAGGGGGGREGCTNSQMIQSTTHNGVQFPLHGADPDGYVRQLVGSCW